MKETLRIKKKIEREYLKRAWWKERVSLTLRKSRVFEREERKSDQIKRGTEWIIWGRRNEKKESRVKYSSSRAFFFRQKSDMLLWGMKDWSTGPSVKTVPNLVLVWLMDCVESHNVAATLARCETLPALIWSSS